MILLGVVFLLIGMLMFFRPVIEGMVSLRNTMMGTQTKITSGTILFYRIGAVILILVSVIIVVASLQQGI